jgi:hypothetical protein
LLDHSRRRHKSYHRCCHESHHLLVPSIAASTARN